MSHSLGIKSAFAALAMSGLVSACSVAPQGDSEGARDQAAIHQTVQLTSNPTQSGETDVPGDPGGSTQGSGGSPGPTGETVVQEDDAGAGSSQTGAQSCYLVTSHPSTLMEETLKPENAPPGVDMGVWANFSAMMTNKFESTNPLVGARRVYLVHKIDEDRVFWGVRLESPEEIHAAEELVMFDEFVAMPIGLAIRDVQYAMAGSGPSCPGVSLARKTLVYDPRCAHCNL